MEALSLILWRERELLDTLLFKLELEQLVLSTGRTRWLSRATREVEAILECIRETEVLRASAAQEAAQALGLDDAQSLSQLADAAPAPWDTILIEHRDAFARATAEIQQLADSNRELITVGYRAARETLDAIDKASSETYSPAGEAVPARRGAASPRFVDRRL